MRSIAESFRNSTNAIPAEWPLWNTFQHSLMEMRTLSVDKPWQKSHCFCRQMFVNNLVDLLLLLYSYDKKLLSMGFWLKTNRRGDCGKYLLRLYVCCGSGCFYQTFAWMASGHFPPPPLFPPPPPIPGKKTKKLEIAAFFFMFARRKNKEV